MARIGFIFPASILDENVPSHFIEPQGTFREYLNEYFVKDDKVLFHVCRGRQQYSPSEVEINLWREYFGIDNEVNYDEQLGNFNTNDNETTDII